MRRGFLFVLLCTLMLSSAAAGSPTSTHVHFTAAGDFSMTVGTTGPVLDALASADPDAHFALGDLSYAGPGSEQPWCDFVTSRVGGGFPFELLAGNHESNGQDGSINDFSACLPNQLPGLVGTYGRQYYVDVPQDDPLVRFVMISPNLTYPDGTWDYNVGTARYNWTAATIDGARTAGIPWVVVGMHKPCLTSGEHGCEPGADISNLLVSKRVDVVLSGHDHDYQRTKQLRFAAGCMALVPNTYNPSCVADSDNDLTAGAGSVFMTIGTGGVALRDLDTADPEAPYFAASSGLNQNPTYGFGDFDVTPTTLTMGFVRGAGGTFTDGFTVTRGGDPLPNQDPVALFTSSSQSLTASFDGSGSVDFDGTISSYAWDFGESTGDGTGATPQHTYAQAGTYDVTLTVTDNDGVTGSVMHPVTVTVAPQVQVLAADQFERTLTNKWGSAQTGGAWSVDTSAGVSSVSAGKGRTVMRIAGTGPVSYLNGVSTTDLDLRFEYALDKLPTGTNGRVDLTGLLRRVSGGDYRSVVRVQANGAVRASLYRVLTGGARTLLGSDITIPGLTYNIPDTLMVRAQATGTAPTNVRLKVWKLGDSEPAAWTVTSSDSAAALQAPGSIGLQAYLSGPTTNAPIQARFDNLSGVVASTLP